PKLKTFPTLPRKAQAPNRCGSSCFSVPWMSRKIGEVAYNPDRRRRSSVAEQPPCKRQVVCSIQTGGTKRALRSVSARGTTPCAVGRNCAIYVFSASAGRASLVSSNRQRPAGGGVPCVPCFA